MATKLQRTPTHVIDSFSGVYHFLDNFYIEPDGTHVEGEFQAYKCPRRKSEFNGLTPGAAKALGQRVQLRPDWESIKDGVMLMLVRKKFTDHPRLAEYLLATGNAELIEGNHHGDVYWGTVNGHGRNQLGKTLMWVRDDLRKGLL